MVDGSARDPDAAIAAVHDADYITRFHRAAARGDGMLDAADNPLSGLATWDAARAAVAAALDAADAVIDDGGGTFVAVRPPGHHAERDHAMGFCFFNTVACVAQHLRDARGLDRVAIVDLDVHHGNGTQHLFERDPNVLFVSLHQHPLYPGTGLADERGRGDGVGATCNVPLAAGADDAVYADALATHVDPVLADFKPEILLISLGFDVWQHDLLGGMRVTEAGYASWGRWARAQADALCAGRALTLVEGGYDVSALGALAVAYACGFDEGGDFEEDQKTEEDRTD
ncbi:MAG: histone deacetylase [Acidobacteriota bacterium]